MPALPGAVCYLVRIFVQNAVPSRFVAKRAAFYLRSILLVCSRSSILLEERWRERERCKGPGPALTRKVWNRPKFGMTISDVSRKSEKEAAG